MNLKIDRSYFCLFFVFVLLSLQSIESNGHAVIARSDLRRRVRVPGTDERLLERLRLPAERRHDVVV